MGLGFYSALPRPTSALQVVSRPSHHQEHSSLGFRVSGLGFGAWLRVWGFRFRVVSMSLPILQPLASRAKVQGILSQADMEPHAGLVL